MLCQVVSLSPLPNATIPSEFAQFVGLSCVMHQNKIQGIYHFQTKELKNVQAQTSPRLIRQISKRLRPYQGNLAGSQQVLASPMAAWQYAVMTEVKWRRLANSNTHQS